MKEDLTTVIVCERWPIPLGRSGGDQWFVDWVRRSTNQSSVHVTAGYHAYKALRTAYPESEPFRSAAEYFGGMGCQSLIIQELFGPADHSILEIHPLAADHLRHLLGKREGVAVVEGDASTADLPAELIGLDVGNLTILQAQGALRPLLERVFAAGPKAVVLTDIAGQRLHLQKDRYERLLGHDCSTYPDYLHGLAEYLRETYGYQAMVCYHHRWSAVMTLIPESREIPLVIQPVPAEPRGIQLR